MILVAQLALLAALYQLLTPAPADKRTGKPAGACAEERAVVWVYQYTGPTQLWPSMNQTGTWLPAPETAQGEKLAYERFVLRYTPFWIGVFAIIVGCQLYESFTAVRAWSYAACCPQPT